MTKRNKMIAFRRFRDITGRLSKIGQTRNWHANFHNLLAIIDIVDIFQYNRQALD